MTEYVDYNDFIKSAQNNIFDEATRDWLDRYKLDNSKVKTLRLGFYDPQRHADLKEFLDRIHEAHKTKCPIVSPSIIVPYDDNGYFETICLDPDAPLIVRGARTQIGQMSIWSEYDLWTSSGNPILVAPDIITGMMLKCSGASVIYQKPLDIQALRNKLTGKSPTGPLVFLPRPGEPESIKGEIEDFKPILDQIGVGDIVAFAYDFDNYSMEDYKDLMDPDKGLEGIASFVGAVTEWVNRGSKGLQEQYGRISGAGLIPDFKQFIYSKTSRDATPTGFVALDERLEGGLYPGLYIIGAPSSVGKTTFALQVADQIAQGGKDVLFFTLEQSAFELIAKSISRLSYLNSTDFWDSLTAGKILHKAYEWDTETKQMIEGKMALYEDEIGLRMHFIESDEREEASDPRIGLDSINAYIKRHIAITGHKPTVFIDYLQIIRPDDPTNRKSDKQNMDEIVSGLRILAKNHGITIFAISSYSRANYNSPASMSSFKESGAIEYSSDVLMSLEPFGLVYGKDDKGKNQTTYKEFRLSTEKEVGLVILKNRMGKTGDPLPFIYHSLFNCYEEVSEASGDDDDGLVDPPIQRF